MKIESIKLEKILSSLRAKEPIVEIAKTNFVSKNTIVTIAQAYDLDYWKDIPCVLEDEELPVSPGGLKILKVITAILLIGLALLTLL